MTLRLSSVTSAGHTSQPTEIHKLSLPTFGLSLTKQRSPNWPGYTAWVRQSSAMPQLQMLISGTLCTTATINLPIWNLRRQEKVLSKTAHGVTLYQSASCCYHTSRMHMSHHWVWLIWTSHTKNRDLYSTAPSALQKHHMQSMIRQTKTMSHPFTLQHRSQNYLHGSGI